VPFIRSSRVTRTVYFRSTLLTDRSPGRGSAQRFADPLVASVGPVRLGAGMRWAERAVIVP